MTVPAVSYWEQWLKPLSEEAPCGEDICFSPEFEALKGEVDKSTSLHVSQGTDWHLVRQLSLELLARQSKDLWAFAYAVYALYRLDGVEGCAPAFTVLADVLRIFWDGLYPPASRMQRRLAPLQWLCDRMTHAAETTHFLEERPESLQVLREGCEALQEFLDDVAGPDAPSFLGIFHRIPQLETPAPDAEMPPPDSVSAPPPAAGHAAPSLATTLAVMDTDGKVPAAVLPQLVRNVIGQTRQLAGHFLSLDALDERAYLLHRAALWATLLQPPQADHTRKTQLMPGIPADRMRAYADAVEQKQFREILPQLERAAANAPFWFDGHYLVVRCLEGLQANQAAACIRESLAHLLGRFPELPIYLFKDGSPFASISVQIWMDSFLSPAHEGIAYPGIGVPDFAQIDDSDEEVRLREAVEISREKGVQAGLRHLDAAPAGRSRAAILHGLLQARYCIAVGKKAAAFRLLSSLYTQLDTWNLVDWEPELTARILALLLSTQPKQKGNVSEEMIRRLHWLQLDVALNLFQES